MSTIAQILQDAKSFTFNRDCEEAMPEFPDKYFDLAVVDPPYFEDCGKEIFPGAAVSTTGIRRNRFQSKNWKVPTQEYFSELFRISKEQIIWGCNYYEKFIPFVGRIVWDKKNDTSSFSKAEIAAKSMKIGVDMFRYMWNGMLQENMADKEERIHPTQKPVALYDWIYAKYLPEGGRVIDTHLGSGSNRIAAHKAGNIEFYGYETDPDYFADEEKRFINYVAQTKLF